MLSTFARGASVKFIGSGFVKVVCGNIGESLLHCAERHNIFVPSACEGSGACGTCQLYVNKGMECLSEQDDREADVLDFAIDVRENSRLACRARIVKDGEIECQIPAQNRNII